MTIDHFYETSDSTPNIETLVEYEVMIAAVN